MTIQDNNVVKDLFISRYKVCQQVLTVKHVRTLHLFLHYLLLLLNKLCTCITFFSQDQPTISSVTTIAESDSNVVTIVISTTAATSALAAIGAVLAVVIVCTRLSLCKQRPSEKGW